MSLTTNNCSVFNCANTRTTELRKGHRIFRIPSAKVQTWHLPRRQAWVKFCQRPNNKDGTPWEPGKHHWICSDHFVGRAKSEDPRHPGYNPTIRKLTKEKEKQNKVLIERYQRMIARTNPKRIQKMATVVNDDMEETPVVQGPLPLLCLICCQPCPSSSYQVYTPNSDFTCFCRHLYPSTTLGNNFLSSLKSNPSLSFCANCLSSIVSTNSATSTVEKWEGKVALLQKQLLEALRNLQEAVGHLKLKMDRLQNKVIASNKKVLQSYLDPKKDNTEIFNFRKRIDSQVKSLEEFRGELQNKVECDQKPPPIPTFLKDPPPSTSRDPPPTSSSSKDPPQRSSSSKDPSQSSSSSKDPPQHSSSSKDPPQRSSSSKDPPQRSSSSKDPPQSSSTSRDPPPNPSSSKDPPPTSPPEPEPCHDSPSPPPPSPPSPYAPDPLEEEPLPPLTSHKRVFASKSTPVTLGKTIRYVPNPFGGPKIKVTINHVWNGKRWTKVMSPLPPELTNPPPSSSKSKSSVPIPIKPSELLLDRPLKPCPNCQKPIRQDGLNSHQKYYCPLGAKLPVPRPHLCHLCSKQFTRKDLLETHISTVHEENRPFLCSQCPYTGKTLKHLEIHERGHSAIRDLLCRKGCGGAFKQPGTRFKHEKLCNGNGTPFRKKAKKLPTS